MVDLQAWLKGHTKVRKAIFWETPPGAIANPGGTYDEWSDLRKQRLLEAFDAASARKPTALVHPPTNIAKVADEWGDASTAFQESDAWDLYVTHVAQSLAVEINKWVPWSLQSYAPEPMAILLDSRQMFAWSPLQQGYLLDWFLHGSVVPLPPDRAYQFLIDRKMVPEPVTKPWVVGAMKSVLGAVVLAIKLMAMLARASLKGWRGFKHDLSLLFENRRIQAMAHLFDWCRTRMKHFPGGLTDKGNAKGIWGYRGVPPVQAIIDGTTPGEGAAAFIGVKNHYTAGCKGTLGFLRTILRTVNIPVARYDTPEIGHAMPSFPTLALYLSHGDDLYAGFSGFAEGEPAPYPSAELLVDKATMDGWFVPAGGQKNLGRRCRDLARKYLIPALLKEYCDGGKAKVAAGFDSDYTLAELETMGLFKEIEDKIASLGGCQKI